MGNYPRESNNNVCGAAAAVERPGGDAAQSAAGTCKACA